MGRTLKRVPLDFDYPLGKVWEGYAPSLETFQQNEAIVKQVPEILDYLGNVCDACEEQFNDCNESARYCVWHNRNLRNTWYQEPPVGEGYQLWETTSEGSPKSPVFDTLDALCAWCEEHATTFADFKATKEQWKQMLGSDFVHHTQGNMTFL